VEQTFERINLLVLEGDAAVLAEHVARLARSRAVTPSGQDAQIPT